MTTAFIQPQKEQFLQTQGKLSHLSFAVKDLIDVKGYVTGGGNPTWHNTHDIAHQNAPCVQQLFDAGAKFKGKTITDELAYSLEGRNHFFGTPLNPNWPHAMPGGSSSGSASAVAQHLVDFALGTDTGGSVRVPAAFCGIWGIRPTHQAISLEGVLPFANSFDTVGWFAHDVDTFIEVGNVLLPEDQIKINLDSVPLLGVTEAFDYRQQNDPQQGDELFQYCCHLGMQHKQSILKGKAAQWLECYQYLQDAEIKKNLGTWIEEYSPKFGPLMQENFKRVMNHDGYLLEFYTSLRTDIAQSIHEILNHHILLLPTTPMALLNLNVTLTTLENFYQQSLSINAIAGLAGVPQINIPIQNTKKYPISLSLIGPRHSDRQLLQLAKKLFLKCSK